MGRAFEFITTVNRILSAAQISHYDKTNLIEAEESKQKISGLCIYNQQMMKQSHSRYTNLLLIQSGFFHTMQAIEFGHQSIFVGMNMIILGWKHLQKYLHNDNKFTNYTLKEGKINNNQETSFWLQPSVTAFNIYRSSFVRWKKLLPGD